MNCVVCGLKGYDKHIEFLKIICVSLFDCKDRFLYRADEYPRYSSGYRRGGDAGHEFWHYCEDDGITKWPSSLSSALPVLNKISRKAKIEMIDFISSNVDNGITFGAAINDSRHFITRFRFVKYHPSEETRFNEHIDSGGATMFVFESAPGLQIKQSPYTWQSVSTNNYPLMVISSGAQDAFGIPAVPHRVLRGETVRYSCAIFLHGKYQDISSLLKGDAC